MTTNLAKDFDDIFLNRNHDLPTLLNKLQSLLRYNVRGSHSITSDLIDIALYEEIKDITFKYKACIYFGKTLRDIKCVVKDSHIGEYKIFIQYKGRHKLRIIDVDLPYSPIQNDEYSTLGEILTTFKKYINNRSAFFCQLKWIDEQCTVVEPRKPTHKDTYRKIMLDKNVFLHIDVTPNGLASNMHITSQNKNCERKLQKLLLSWDHDKDIVENIMTVFDVLHFSTPSAVLPATQKEKEVKAKSPECGICLSVQLPDEIGIPQPLCQNTTCGVYFHKTCLVQWLKSCNCCEVYALGLLIGNCPSCSQPITCNEKDN